ncbi:MAG: MBOAT family protein [Lachnospiraceae bacterium]|nr:MBOAT family protein [Lachnospiraceae bacterium]
MLFSSLSFLYYFLPIVLILYIVSPKKLKNLVILLSSLVFYAWGEPKYVILMIISILLGYIFGLLIEKLEKGKLRKFVLILSIVSGLGMLGYFKYADFFIDNFNKVTGLDVAFLNVALPIGISFYTFQMLSYELDVWRGDVKAQRNLINLAAYISMFPQLIAGPIVRYKDVAEQLEQRTHTLEKTAYGIRRFAIGMGKKILLANTLGEIAKLFKASNEQTVLFAWIYAIATTLQIYFDFSGYSDMAIGLGSIMGFKFPENFNYPLTSKSVTEFWRRWHMTLGGWFRDYLYIPLGGNRVSALRWIFNILVVWMATGFWHGASWNFVLWGLYFAILLVVEKKFIGKFLAKSKVLNHVYLTLLILISFVIFDNVDMSQGWQSVLTMFGLGGSSFASTESIFYLKDYIIIILIGIVGATSIPKLLVQKLAANETGRKVLSILEPLFIAALFIVCTSYLVNGSFNPFLYFRF